MADLIDRQTAVCAIEEYADRLQMVDWNENPGVKYKAHALNWCTNTIRDLPSAEPERKKGKWIYSDDDDPLYDSYFCSCCHRYITVDAERKCDIGFIIDDFDFCPHCGAEMREHDDI